MHKLKEFYSTKFIKCDIRNSQQTKTISHPMATEANIKDATKFEPSKALMHSKIIYNKGVKGN